ncbi:MAG: DUF6378 domain-containing protein [Magnetococcus sp. YQC-3]
MNHKPKTGLEMLAEVQAVLEARQAVYGSPVDNFKTQATRWCQHMPQFKDPEAEFGPLQVAFCMMDAKMARLISTPDHYDSLLDIIGYAVCAQDIIRDNWEWRNEFWSKMDEKYPGRVPLTYPSLSTTDFDEAYDAYGEAYAKALATLNKGGTDDDK